MDSLNTFDIATCRGHLIGGRLLPATGRIIVLRAADAPAHAGPALADAAFRAVAGRANRTFVVARPANRDNFVIAPCCNPPCSFNQS
jgi:hypothetical protein